MVSELQYIYEGHLKTRLGNRFDKQQSGKPLGTIRGGQERRNTIERQETRPHTTQAPVVSSAGGVNRPASVHLSVTVAGLNFRALDWTATAQAALGACATAAWSSTTSVACMQSTTGSQADSSLVLTVSSGLVGTASNRFTFDGHTKLFRRGAFSDIIFDWHARSPHGQLASVGVQRRWLTINK